MTSEPTKGLDSVRLEIAAVVGAFRSIGPVLFGVMDLVTANFRLWATTRYGTWMQGQVECEEYARWEDDGGSIYEE